MTAYYNENDPKAAAWLRELIKAGHIAPGIVDERDIRDVRADDLAQYAQCHFFAGIGGWSYALRLAGWPDERRVWTGSCPCQPFSVAGMGKGIADERHLWPTFAALIRAGRPPIVFGEQVASAAGRGWLAGVFADLEGMDYYRAAADLCAAGVGAPHIRQRLWWMAYAANNNGRRGISGTETATWPESIGGGRLASGSTIGRLDLAAFKRSAPRLSGPHARQKGHAGVIDDAGDQKHATGGGKNLKTVWLVHAKRQGLEGQRGHENDCDQPGWIAAESHRSASEAGTVNFWSRCVIIPCADGQARRAEPESFPLADGVSGRVGLLRGYGNAINPQLAAEFIQASTEAIILWTQKP